VVKLQGKVAVITGAASGIGRALAERCCDEGMKVVLADVEAGALAQAEAALAARGARRSRGSEIRAVVTDVAVEAEVQALAQRALEAFGAVHLVVNNAGVGAGGLLWEAPLVDWQFVMNVNLWGVVHGIRAFVPILLRQGEGHVVNTASMAGLLVGPGNGIYAATKAAVVSLSETLHHELTLAGGRVGVSVLCPGWVRTRILESDRNRPSELQRPARPLRPEEEAAVQFVRQALETGMPPERVASEVLEAVKADRFWVLPHAEYDPFIEQRARGIVARRNPELPPPPPPKS
jgi:NAD(P)-dependent dehydrogenase (short-subunit alcohol dehydrogenase family)